MEKIKRRKTGYQENMPWAPELDLQCDFVMAYGLDDTLKERMEGYRKAGYEVCLMTGCAWGNYEDYLDGNWDGVNHWDECQIKRNQELILHGIRTPYMVPTENFGKYLAEKLFALVDAGVGAIFMEEPEFWDAGGYGKAFQKEYEKFYGESWQPPYASLDARYRCGQLKTYLYARLVEYLATTVKKYSRETYGRETDFYVATHSLVNYAQWKIASPESQMLTMENVDGFIAQIWSGTSGTGNVYQGHYCSRTFETAYLEYGIMEEMVKNTGKQMWFLHDPVEDFPENGWEVYAQKYKKTLAASLFYPSVNRYEVCPWPNRVINGRYPKKLGMAEGMIPTTDMEGAKDIPESYASILSGMIQTLGGMKQEEGRFLLNAVPVGILMSDTSLHQRSFPDEIPSRCKEGRIDMQGGEERMNEAVLSRQGKTGEEDFYEKIETEEGEFYAYVAGCTYPSFFGLAMPLLKHGLPLRPVYMERLENFPGDLAQHRYLLVSYEYMKPEKESYQKMLVEWVKGGGCLIYVGDGTDPYHKITAWWNKEKPGMRADEKLMQDLGLEKNPQPGIYSVEKGWVAYYRKSPAKITLSQKSAADYRCFVKQTLEKTGYKWEETNCLAMERGNYRIVSVMNESCSMSPYQTTGLFTDLCKAGYPVLTEIEVACGEEAILFDYSKIQGQDMAVIATAARIEKLQRQENTIELWEKAADRIWVATRLRLPWQPLSAEAVDEDGEEIALCMDWDERSKTVLLSYHSKDKMVKIRLTRG